MSSTALVQQPAANALARSGTQSPARQSPVTRSKTVLPSLSLTPQAQAKRASSPATELTPSQSTPGQWQHPRMNEVIRRQHANQFDSGNVKSIVASLVAMGLTMGIKPALVYLPLSTLTTSPYLIYTILVFRALLFLNVAFATSPLWKSPDTCEDIPLDSKQRHALGLPPMSRPATPQEEAQYVTPPRYSRSATPTSTGSLRVQARGSPLSDRGTPPSSYGSESLQRQNSGGSPYSASPLTNKLFRNDDARVRRGSFGSLGTGRASSLGESELERISSPPMAGKSGRASVGLNNKWLYQKDRASPGTIGRGWGTGSVFN